LEEVASLRNSVDHVKQIVSRQQEYAKISAATERVKVERLIDDSLQMSVVGSSARGFKITREHEPSLPEITVAKHNVLQILVNLIRNAQQACDLAGHPEKHLILRAGHCTGGVKISVIDNGVGITEENLKRIFTHGFTTRKNGHGFGLHSGALTAREMGGSLQVHSDGPGFGAAFTLELPIEPPEEDEIQGTRLSGTSSGATRISLTSGLRSAPSDPRLSQPSAVRVDNLSTDTIPPRHRTR
jgi:signal transduction histidine kinase